uniref:Uncharacterized protein n=1 Tax=Coccidioides posadasii RMSCC 3488 TaxID=454284 RepID=A0A0J6FE53_COCPO|nr:hypothetical protein CPAG_07713 [Coccidioides posadasii RMSCC 3488]
MVGVKADVKSLQQLTSSGRAAQKKREHNQAQKGFQANNPKRPVGLDNARVYQNVPIVHACSMTSDKRGILESTPVKFFLRESSRKFFPQWIIFLREHLINTLVRQPVWKLNHLNWPRTRIDDRVSLRALMPSAAKCACRSAARNEHITQRIARKQQDAHERGCFT